MYAEVVVNLLNRNLDRVFHYVVPPVLKDKVREGTQVIVPFGPRLVDGYVVGFSESTDKEKLKEIIEVTEETPLFGHQMLELARWIAKTYLCSLVDSIHLIMPPGQKLAKKKKLYYDETNAAEGEGLRFAAYSREKETYQEIIDYMTSSKGHTELERLQKKFGAEKINSFRSFLEEYGVGGLATEFKSKTRKKKGKQVFVAERYKDQIPELIEGLGRKAPKQAEVLQVLNKKSPIMIPELLASGCSKSAVMVLLEKGILEVSEIELLRDPFSNTHQECYAKPELTGEQAVVLQKILKALYDRKFTPFLLHGVTGSGKTEVYLRAIEKCLQQGKQAICLVPEISLTPQTIKRFRGRFGDAVAVLHSALSAGERFDQWRQVSEGRVQVVVGARSAVFAPVPNLGLIILDEEHETTYKQEDSPKYHAREVAYYRTRQSGGVLILGSATPSLESYHLAEQGRLSLLEMPHRVDNKAMPKVEIVDMRAEMESGNRSIFSNSLYENIVTALDRKEQVILFLNRRGYSTYVSCRECGYVARCKSCNVSLTYHAKGDKVLCHYCGYSTLSPKMCPLCQSRYIRYFGLGTQKVEDEVGRLFPQARVLRMDVDSTGKKGSHERILSQFGQGEADILIGTQMIAKGLDFPRVTVVGVIMADTALNLPDFRSAERTFQLLTQVAGRAGRAELPGKVVLQTYEPNHYSVLAAVKHDYNGFYRAEKTMRRDACYPPYCQLARIVITGFDENKVIRAAHLLAEGLQLELRGKEIGVDQPMLGPAPAPLVRLRNNYRWQICLKALTRQEFSGIINIALFDSGLRDQFKDLNFNIEIDPQSLL